MDSFLLTQEKALLVETMPELAKQTDKSDIIREYPFIREFGRQKFEKVKLDTLTEHTNDGIEICYVHKGKYTWQIEQEQFELYPGDAYITCPWETHYPLNGFLDIGVLNWIIIKPQKFGKGQDLFLGEWSQLSLAEQKKIGQIISQTILHYAHQEEIGGVLNQIYIELNHGNFGSKSRVHALLDRLFILFVRSFQSEGASIEHKINIRTLDRLVLGNLSHPWTVQQIANHFGTGITNFTSKVKKLTGYTPVSYVIHLRINEAQKLLTSTQDSLTEIGLQCGFYSLQHFSDTFKKRVGMYPGEYRKKI